MNENAKIDGELIIKVVDKNDKTIVEVREKNALKSGFSSGICGELAGETDVYLGVLDEVDLYDSANALIKALTEANRTALTHNTYADHDDVYVKFEDSSTDSYTVARADLMSHYGGTGRLIAQRTGLSVNKGSDQKLIVEWRINVYFS